MARVRVAYRTPYTRAPVVRGTGSPLPPFLSISPLELLERQSPPSPPPSPRMVAIQRMIGDLVEGTPASERVPMLRGLFALEPRCESKDAARDELRENGEHSSAGETTGGGAWDEFVHWGGPPTPHIPTTTAAAENVEFLATMEEHTNKSATQRSRDKAKKVPTRRSARIGAQDLLHLAHSSDSSQAQ